MAHWHKHTIHTHQHNSLTSLSPYTQTWHGMSFYLINFFRCCIGWEKCVLQSFMWQIIYVGLHFNNATVHSNARGFHRIMIYYVCIYRIFTPHYHIHIICKSYTFCMKKNEKKTRTAFHPLRLRNAQVYQMTFWFWKLHANENPTNRKLRISQNQSAQTTY